MRAMASGMARGRVERGRNVVLVLLLFAELLFSAFTEGYLGLITWPFALLLAGGFGLAMWLATRISTVRLLALLLSIFFMEYAKETIGIRCGLWVYHGNWGQYLFGVLSWVAAGVSTYALATGIAIPLLSKLRWPALAAPSWLAAVVVLVVFVLIPLRLGPYSSGTGRLFWMFYAVLLVAALLATRRMPSLVFAGVVLSAWFAGNPSEYFGSALSGAWTFPHDAKYPPFYLLACCWPLEILVQYFLSALLAGESPSGEAAPAQETKATPSAAPEPTRNILSGVLPVVSPREGHESKMHLSAEERALRLVLRLSGFAFLVVGFAFAIIPDAILNAVNKLSEWLTPLLDRPQLPKERFWVALAFSMMMTIAALSFLAGRNVRRNKGYVFPLLLSKAASSVSALAFFAFYAHHLASLVITVVDGGIFWFILIFFLRAQRAFFREQTDFLKKHGAPPHSSGPATVAAIRGDDKLACLDQVLAETKFYDVLEKRLTDSGKARDAFSVAIKPNFMFMHSKRDTTSYTDPALVEALVDRIAAKGFKRITLVETQSTYGNYYSNREVVTVAEYIGYARNKNYQIVDLTQEKVTYDYGGRLGKHVVGPTWRDADFRISFAKNKTHVFCNYTLTLKNVYGTLPMQDKLKEYHTKREYDWPTIETLKHFPVHFGLIDAFTSADGQFGVIADPAPNPTRTIIGGDNLLAVDWVGAKKMGLDPDDPSVGRYLPLAMQAFGRPEVRLVGDTSTYPDWHNVSAVFIRSLDLIEEAYAFSNWSFSVLTAMDPFFKFKKKAWATLAVRRMLAPLKRLLYPYDAL